MAHAPGTVSNAWVYPESMKLLLGVFLIASALSAQSSGGTVTQSTTSSVIGTAGPLVCTLTNSSPALPSGVHVVCINNGASVLVMDSAIPVGQNGMVGSMALGGNIVTWIVQQLTAGTFTWQMAANGVGRSGTF